VDGVGGLQTNRDESCTVRDNKELWWSDVKRSMQMMESGGKQSERVMGNERLQRNGEKKRMHARW
jgi:hypothetical protein